MRSSSERNAGLSAMSMSALHGRGRWLRRGQLRGGARRPHARRTLCTLSVRPRAPTKQMAPYRPPALPDFPGFAGVEELRDVARSAVRDRLLLLLDEDLLVRGLLLKIEQRSQGDREVRRPELRQAHGGGAVARV